MSRLISTGPSAHGSSEIIGVSRCLTKVKYERVAGRSPSSPAQMLGTLLHQGLAQHYAIIGAKQGGCKVGDWPELVTDPSTIMDPQEAIEQCARDMGAGPDQTQEICEVFEAYVRFYSDDWRTWRILAVERVLEAQVKDPNHPDRAHPGDARNWQYTQRADLIIAEGTMAAAGFSASRIWVIDHKKAFAILGKTLRNHTLSAQMLGYQALGQAKWGDKFAGVKLNRVSWRTDKKTGLVGKHKYDRSPLNPAPSAVGKYWEHVRTQRRRLARAEATGHWPPAFDEMVCHGKYGACPWMEKCQWG